MICLAMAAALAFTDAHAQFAYQSACFLAENHSPRDAGTRAARAAAQYIFDSVNILGADAKIDTFKARTPDGDRLFFNVESRYVSDPANEWIVLISHFDTKRGTESQGANDGASTTGLLLALRDAVNAAKPDSVNVLFLWTDGEECMYSYEPDDGFWGSKHAAASIKEEGLAVSCAICLDMLGDRNLDISIAKNSSSRLKRELMHVAGELSLLDKVRLGADAVKDDHLAFAKAGFEAADLIDFEYGSAKGLNDWWHTPEDTVDKISAESLGVAGRLVSGFLDLRNEKARKRRNE